jgi:hypothetical protein
MLDVSRKKEAKMGNKRQRNLQSRDTDNVEHKTQNDDKQNKKP